jgi:hypothetical protein
MKAGLSKMKLVKLVGKLREVESEEEKQGIDEGKKGELRRMIRKLLVMNKELEKLQEAIDELREELGL